MRGRARSPERPRVTADGNKGDIRVTAHLQVLVNALPAKTGTVASDISGQVRCLRN